MEFLVITRPRADVELPGVYAGPVSVPLAGVDWQREFVLVADMGEQRTGGYAVRPGTVSSREGEVQVQLQVTTPPPGGMVAQVITHPYAVLRIPRPAPGLATSIVVQDQAGNLLGRIDARPDQEG